MSMTAEGINPRSSVTSVSDLSDWLLHLVQARLKLKAKEVRIDAGAVATVWITFSGFYVSLSYSEKFLRAARAGVDSRRKLKADIRSAYHVAHAKAQRSRR